MVCNSLYRALGLAAVSCVLLLGAAVASAITIDTVSVGDAGNTADTTGYGRVDYAYNIGKYEVTAGQYTAFLNAVAKTDTYALYKSIMWTDAAGCKIQRSGSSGNYVYTVASEYADRPVNCVNFWDSCRFANWLNNGQQGAGTTEYGAYSLNGVLHPTNESITRNTGAQWAVTSENEWYKAAYYKGGSANAGYWMYPTRSDTAPGKDMADLSGNNANYRTSPYQPIDSGKYTTLVGEFQNSASPYGTFDQVGNVWEWNEAITRFGMRGQRGGSFDQYNNNLRADLRHDNALTYEGSSDGFRVVQLSSAAVPVPAALWTGGAGLMCVAVMRRMRRR